MNIEKVNGDLACHLCGPDGGVMEAKKINDRTYIWVCDECPAVLFEFIDSKNTEDLHAYLERDRHIL